SELDFARGARRVDAQREERPQQRLPLLPVDLRREVDPPAGAPQGYPLPDRTLTQAADDLERGAYRPFFDYLPACNILDRIRLLLVEDVDVPGLPVERPIFVSRQPIATSPLGDYLPVVAEII